jgi:hypothetical protein
LKLFPLLHEGCQLFLQLRVFFHDHAKQRVVAIELLGCKHLCERRNPCLVSVDGSLDGFDPFRQLLDLMGIDLLARVSRTPETGTLPRNGLRGSISYQLVLTLEAADGATIQ